MRTRFALVFCVVLLPVFAFAKYMAVLETISQNGLLTLQEEQYLTDILRGQAVAVLPAEQNWTIMADRNVPVDFVAQARISQFGTSFSISAELYETAGNRLVSSFNGRGETIEDIETIIKAQAPEFFKKVRDVAQTDSLSPSLDTLDLRPSVQEQFAQDSIVVAIDQKKDVWNEPAKKEVPQQKRFWAGAFVSATYNDFYGTKFGFGNLKFTDDYTLTVDGADDILGGYWGIGANVGVTGLYLFTPNIALRADLGIASRRGSGKSDAAVKLYWNDGTRMPEKSYLELEYYVRQVNIDVPLALRVLLPMLTYAELGPLMSFNLYSKTKFSVTDIYGTEEFREHDCFSTFEFAMVGGIGVMRPIGKTMLDVGMRFVLGVTPLSDADDSPKTWQWQFNVAYWFI